MSYIPYRLAGPIATYAVGPHDTQTSTLKLILGSVFVLVGWIIEAVVVGQVFGGGWGVLLFVVAPPLAYVALRWGEDWRNLRELVSSRWLRFRRGELVQSLMTQRQILCGHRRAVGEHGADEQYDTGYDTHCKSSVRIL